MAIDQIPRAGGEVSPTAEADAEVIALDDHRPPFKKLIDEETGAVFYTGEFKLENRKVSWTMELPSPGQITYDGLVIAFGGLGATEESQTKLRNASAQAGNATLTFKPARSGEANSLLEPYDLTVRSLEAIDGQVKQYVKEPINWDQKSLLPHSYGGIPAAYYALRHPDQVKDIINLASVGYRPPSVQRLGETAIGLPAGSVRSSYQEAWPAFRSGAVKISLGHLFSFIQHNFSNPLQTTGELVNSVWHDLRPVARQLRELEVPIGSLEFEKDHLVRPSEEVAEHVNRRRVMRGGHWAPMTHPDEVAIVVNDMRSELHDLRAT